MSPRFPVPLSTFQLFNAPSDLAIRTHAMNMHTGTSPAKFHFPFLALLAFLLALANAGCDKSAPSKTPPALTAPAPVGPADTILRLHWLGKKRLSTETNAAGFMKIWNQPESARLEAQTLDKLAAAPWRILTNAEPAKPGTGDTNALSASASTPSTNSGTTGPRDHGITGSRDAAALRPLLDDLVQEETYWEISQATNQPGEIALAIRLSPERHRVWETNLAAVLASLPEPGTPGSRLGTLKKHVELRRAGAWTLVSLNLNPNPNPSAPVPDANLLTRWASLIQRDGHPYAAPATNYWLTGDVDIAGLIRTFSLSWTLPTNTPRISFTVIGDGENVRTRGELNFAEPLNLKLEPWNIPTNLVQEPLIAFTAIRNVAPWLNKIGPFAEFPSNSIPDQFFLWDRTGLPFNTFFALSVRDAAKSFELLAPTLINRVNPLLGPTSGSLGMLPGNTNVLWKGLIFAVPFIRTYSNDFQQFLFGGFAQGPYRPVRMPGELAQHIQSITNLIYFDWEETGQRIIHWRYFDDAARILFDDRGPRLTKTLALDWIACCATNLSYSTTELRVEGACRISFARKSAMGFSALELNFLANWAETADFPGGIHNLAITNALPVAPKPRLRRAAVATNAPMGPAEVHR